MKTPQEIRDIKDAQELIACTAEFLLLDLDNNEGRVYERNLLAKSHALGFSGVWLLQEAVKFLNKRGE